MARQQFTSTERQAFWEAYNRTCAYCGEPVRFRDFQIDHIVPEYLLDQPSDLETIRLSLGLPLEFDLTSYSNLAPSCKSCNDKKRGSILPNASIQLTVAKRKERVVILLREKIKKEADGEKVRVVMSAALASGAVSREQLAVALAEPSLNTYMSGTVLDLIIPDLIHGMSDDDYEALLDIQATNSPIEVGLKFDGGDRELVTTLREFRDRMAKGAYAPTQADITNAFNYFETPLGVLDILRQATLPDTSFIREPYAGLVDIELLPVSLLYSFDRPMVTEDITIRDLVKNGEAQIIDVGSGHIVIDWQSFRTSLYELMRIDVDNDGIEEMVAYAYGKPVPNGTLRIGRLIVLGRKSIADRFAELNVAND